MGKDNKFDLGYQRFCTLTWGKERPEREIQKREKKSGRLLEEIRPTS